MPKKPDMTLVVDVVLNGTVNRSGVPSISARYYQGPTVPNSSNVVDGSGDVSLLNMAFDPTQYDVDTDITFNLSGQIVDDNGNPVSFNFPSNPAQAVTITKQSDGRMQLTPRSGTSPMQLIIDDENNDSETYSYCLAVELGSPAPSGTVIRLDPSIVNR